VAENVGKVFGQILAFCIAGHHTGLPDETSSDDATQRSTLRHKLDPVKYLIPCVSGPKIELPPLTLPLKPTVGGREDAPFQLAFFTRMLFSCLIDADRTRTEEFCDPVASAERSRLAERSRPSLASLKEQLDASLRNMQRDATPTDVNRQRTIVLECCRQAADMQPGFFSLNVPTGGRKTLSSLAFALQHALKYKLRRVVVAIPFTSIIEQTADVYRAALGPFAASGLVEHHTNLQPVRDTRSNQLGAENWDAPLIVTTNVQLLESLFAYRTTPCRKLHNLARSVIVLDEAQTIPVELLKPALAALRELALNYGCSIVICTATQPALERRTDFEIGLEAVRPIIPDAVPLFHALKRVGVRPVGKLTDDELASRLAHEKSVRAQVVGARDLHLIYHRQHRLGAQFPVMGALPARTGQLTLIRSRGGKLQQLGQGGGTRTVHGRADCGLDRFQIQMPGLAPATEDHTQKLIYFARDFLADRFCRFFSWADGIASATGRSLQICSFTSRSCSPSSRKRWHSATSRCALAKLAGEENVSVTVFPFTLRVSRK
jgi:hypothetical protein